MKCTDNLHWYPHRSRSTTPSLTYIVQRVSSVCLSFLFFFFFSSRRRHTRFDCDWSSDVCSSDLRFSQVSEPDNQASASLVGEQDVRSAGMIGFHQFAMHRGESLDHGTQVSSAKIGRASCRERV